MCTSGVGKAAADPDRLFGRVEGVEWDADAVPGFVRYLHSTYVVLGARVGRSCLEDPNTRPCVLRPTSLPVRAPYNSLHHIWLQ